MGTVATIERRLAADGAGRRRGVPRPRGAGRARRPTRSVSTGRSSSAPATAGSAARTGPRAGSGDDPVEGDAAADHVEAGLGEGDGPGRVGHVDQGRIEPGGGQARPGSRPKRASWPAVKARLSSSSSSATEKWVQRAAKPQTGGGVDGAWPAATTVGRVGPDPVHPGVHLHVDVEHGAGGGGGPVGGGHPAGV